MQIIYKKLRNIIPPTIKIIVRYILPTRETSMFNVERNKYVPQGTLKERVQYTNRLNEILKSECVKHELTNQKEELADEYCDGSTHYNVTSLSILQKELKENFYTILHST